jgi:hypothetical protein
MFCLFSLTFAPRSPAISLVYSCKLRRRGFIPDLLKNLEKKFHAPRSNYSQRRLPIGSNPIA